MKEREEKGRTAAVQQSVAYLQTQQTAAVCDICRSVAALRFVAWNGARRSDGRNLGGGVERGRRWCYSKAAIVEPQQLMDHVDISNAVDITDAFGVAGGATSELSSCLGF